MAHQETSCHWAIELCQAAAIFAAGTATAAVAAVGFFKNGSVAALILGGLPTVILFAIGFRLSSVALRKRRSGGSGLEVEGDEEDGSRVHGVAAHGPHHRDFMGLPAIALAQLRELSLQNNKVEGVHRSGGGDGDECAVCLGKIGDDGVPVRLLACRHVLHKHCIEQWLRVHPTCPICRRNVLPDSPVVVLRVNA